MKAVVALLLGVSACDVVFPLNDEPVCPQDYGRFPTGRYRLVDESVRWQGAEAVCRADSNGASTHLVVISNVDEFTLVSTIAGPLSGEVWIGFSDRGLEGDFRWVSTEDEVISFGKEPQTFPWANAEPNDSQGNEDCAALSAGGPEGTLNDIDCDAPRTFICECDAFSSDPP